MAAPSAATAADTVLEAESMSLPSGTGAVFSDSSASGGRALLHWSSTTASKTVTLPASDRIVVRAKGDQCGGAPEMVVRVDGYQVLSATVTATAWTDYPLTRSINGGLRTVTVSYTNDYRTSSCDRNLRVDKVSFRPAPPNPFSAAKLYVDPYSNAKRQADAWRSSRPTDAAQMDKTAAGAQADWFGDWNADIRAAVSARVSTISAAGALPVLVAYDIPQRDCGSWSAGGAGSATAYKTWIRAFADGIGTRRAIVILEPDALAGMGCLSASDRLTRLSLLSDAVGVLEAKPGVSVYIDAGHSAWIGSAEMASRLASAGIAKAQGFSLNVSNYRTTTGEVTYGTDLSSRVGGKHFVVDTSRNGLGPSPDGQWCNPPGRALGPRSTASTGKPLVDAYFWIKRPGESDGACNGGPPAGQWWADYALGLAQRAAY